MRSRGSGAGVYKVGVAPPTTYAGNSREKDIRGGSGNAEDMQICRAFYKLQEAIQVANVDARFSFEGTGEFTGHGM